MSTTERAMRIPGPTQRRQDGGPIKIADDSSSA